MLGSGDVLGGIFYAIAWGISGDGTTLVGPARTNHGSRDEAYLWTANSAFVLPDPAHGANFGSSFQAVSGDGSIAVGGTDADAMIWDPANGMRDLHDVLEDAGLDVDGWFLSGALDISDDGRTIVGGGIDPLGRPQAWLARLSQVIGVEETLPSLRPLSIQLTSANPFADHVSFVVIGPPSLGPRVVRVDVLDSVGRRVRELWHGDSLLPSHILR